MQALARQMGLTKAEEVQLRKLSTPRKIQDFLDTIPMNHEKNGETYKSPRLVLLDRKAHCMEGALLAAAALWLQGEKPLLMDFRTDHRDEDHVVALYRVNGLWGAISKTNHAILRFRDPVYRTLRELALSYFHEYFLFDTGAKTLRAYSRPFDLRRFGADWVTTEDNLYPLAVAIDDSPHYDLVPRKNIPHLRPADRMELSHGQYIEWKKSDART